MNTKKMFKAFTLVEMLIVIVIIGLLSRALMPRLTSARAKTADAARKVGLRQIANGLTMYQMDKGKYPDSDGGNYDTQNLAIDIEMKKYITSMPKDPKNEESNTYIGPLGKGGYLYMHLFKGGINYMGYALVANVETPGSANRVEDEFYQDPTGIAIFNDNYQDPSGYYSVELISSRLCTQMVKSTQRYNGGTGYCTYTTLQDLRYVLLSP